MTIKNREDLLFYFDFSEMSNKTLEFDAEGYEDSPTYNVDYIGINSNRCKHIFIFQRVYTIYLGDDTEDRDVWASFQCQRCNAILAELVRGIIHNPSKKIFESPLTVY